MKIACLGWGSLIWDSRELGVPRDQWRQDGPSLPIEFTRFSSDGRVTLIIDFKAKAVNVLWAELDLESLEQTVCLLAKREGTRCQSIRSTRASDTDGDEVRRSVINWLKSKKLDAAVWTGLSYKDGVRPSVIQVLEHLEKLEGCDKERAEEYIRKAPRQIFTEYRQAIESKFSWTPTGQ
ncbi:MAG: hypothetical protein WCV80_03745 [Candidatus Paceibacterota bacterium]|jgi:hypothetical protein